MGGSSAAAWRTGARRGGRWQPAAQAAGSRQQAAVAEQPWPPSDERKRPRVQEAGSRAQAATPPEEAREWEGAPRPLSAAAPRHHSPHAPLARRSPAAPSRCSSRGPASLHPVAPRWLSAVHPRRGLPTLCNGERLRSGGLAEEGLALPCSQQPVDGRALHVPSAAWCAGALHEPYIMDDRKHDHQSRRSHPGARPICLRRLQPVL